MADGTTILNTVKFRVVVDGTNAEKSLGNVTQAAQTAQKSTKINMQKMASAAQSAGMAMTLGLTVPLVAAGQQALNAGMSFQQGLANIQAVTGATSDEMGKFTDLIKEMASTTPYGIAEVSQAIEDLSKAGLTTTQIIEGGLYGALNLAAAGGIELEEAANLAARALITFKNDGLSVADAADILVGAANKSTTSVGEIGSSFEMVSVVAANAGMTMADTAAALAVFAQNGMAGSDAGTSLKTMLMNLSPQSAKATKYMKELGIITADGANQFYDASGKMKDMAGIADVMQNAFKGLNDEQRINYMRTIFGQDAIRGATVLYKEGAAGIQAMAEAIEGVDARKVAEKKWDTLNNKIKELKNSLSIVASEIFTRLEPALTSGVDLVTKLVSGLGSMPAWFQNIIIGFASVLAVTGPLLLIFGSTAGAISNIMTIAAVVGPALTAAFAGPLIPILGVVAAIDLLVVGIALASKAYNDHRKAVSKVQSDVKAYHATTDDLLESYKKKTEKATKAAVKDYQNLATNASESLSQIDQHLGDETYKNKFNSDLQAMVDKSKEIISKGSADTTAKTLDLLSKYSAGSAEQEALILQNISYNQEKKIGVIDKAQKKINDISAKYSGKNVKMSEKDYMDIQKSLQEISTVSIGVITKTSADSALAQALANESTMKGAAKASKKFLELNTKNAKEQIAVAQDVAGQELMLIEQLKNDGVINYDTYQSLKIQAVQRYKTAVLEAQTAELKGLIGETKRLQKWSDEFDGVVGRIDDLNKKPTLSIIEQEELDRLTEFYNSNVGAYEKIEDQININKAAIVGFSDEVKVGLSEGEQAAINFTKGIQEIDNVIRSLSTNDYQATGRSIGQKLAIGMTAAFKQRIKALMPQFVEVDFGAESMATMNEYAEGGAMRKGTALVGEAGPELLTVGNGLAQVTPLTGAGKARNVEQAFGGSNVFNISVDGGWDNADRIANRVADTMNRILGSRGVNYVR